MPHSSDFPYGIDADASERSAQVIQIESSRFLGLVIALVVVLAVVAGLALGLAYHATWVSSIAERNVKVQAIEIEAMQKSLMDQGIDPMHHKRTDKP